ncbi:peptidase s8 and s53 subtilisin kexin sedolisin [Fusarium sporotrichioides]|uniref:Peptidase s8 and s53 subtilisin kexin sedolisin n=1 Tax=Fusarium sporotrichioides TaxID=5514 RepID=A0A395RFQ9_FUSSP|nr:peptidase s8 and s53 subtilisin kexin sedolisin [Fusarium sporotrichioides]
MFTRNRLHNGDSERSTEVLSSVALSAVTTEVLSSEDVLVSTSTLSFPASNSFPPTSDLSTELSIIPTLISSLVTTSRETSTLVEQTKSDNPEEKSSDAVFTQPPSSSVTADPVTDSGTTTQSLSTSLATETATTMTSKTIITSSDISTSKVESTAKTTSDISTTTTQALTTSDIETPTPTTTTEEATTTLPPGACGRVLSKPTTIFAPENPVDDSSAQVSLPFAISGFGASGSNIWVSVNGFLTVNSGDGSSAFVNQPLPYAGVAPFSVFPYWDDMAVVGDGQDRIEYEVTGNNGERTVTINWCVKTLALLDGVSNQFTATFYENDPGIALFRYYKTSQRGSSATVGGQNNDAKTFIQYEYDQADSVPEI